MSNKNYGFFLLLCSIGLIISSASGTGYHIPTVAEGLLNDTGCYIGAYLGGNQGANNAMCVNYYRKSNNAPYETQILDHPLEYGEKKTGNSNEELKETDTGIETFRTAIDVLKPGGGKKQLLFSRYYNLYYYPDNDYGKIPYTESPAPYIWAEKVLKQNGIPVLVLYPWALQTNGLLDLTAQNGYHAPMTGVAIITEIAQKCDALSKKYAGSNGKPATILLCFGLEFNTQKIVNPTGIDAGDNENKKAWRQMFRSAYTIVRAHANPSVQMVWAGNIAQTKNDRIFYWPGTDDNGNQMAEDFVDWVGMTWYPWKNGPTTLDDLAGFYNYYARDRNHPMIFMETSADGNGISADELSLKNNQVTYLYNKNTLQKYPNIKGIIWFNVIKGEDNTNQQLVTKNFLIPDGNWNNQGKSTTNPGYVYSSSNQSAMMSSRYPNAVTDPYFVGYSAPSLSADFDLVINKDSMTIICTDTSTGQGINSWKWDVNGDTKPEYYSQNITHRYKSPGNYPITLVISNGMQTHSTTRIVTIPSGYPERDCYLFIGSFPSNAEIWVDNAHKIGITTPNMMTRYLVPGGAHSISLIRDGYTTWTGSYSLKWPQVRYFGQITLNPVLRSSHQNRTDFGGIKTGILTTGSSGGQKPQGIMPGISIKSDSGIRGGSPIQDILPASIPSI
ncbi:PKD domain-containing protein [Methanospirillum sp. J.3.6.1-F.2.7.3]|uniref:PKD domain-containing protein n=1 Tax=Methanospirillum purgamenti TaxID=2834276 RepID=A0A8E7AZI3_9EURY|nr:MULTISPECIES: PKD domain-containing protein [Methanospirillum]MDX8550689.1 PKD domain-containing protein [Methanospirillum hungatei]QVV90245.1 PKD domain-containing protein [Methanospirillum sp. J.3.6.1-F.2.7.3]